MSSSSSTSNRNSSTSTSSITSSVNRNSDSSQSIRAGGCSRSGRSYRSGWKQIDWPADIEALERQRRKKRVNKRQKSADNYIPPPPVPIVEVCKAEIARLRLILNDRISHTEPRRQALMKDIALLKDAQKEIRVWRTLNTKKLFFQTVVLFLKKFKEEIVGIPSQFDINPRNNPQLARYLKMAADVCNRTKSPLEIFKVTSELKRALDIKEDKMKSRTKRPRRMYLNPNKDFPVESLNVGFKFVADAWIEELKNMPPLPPSPVPGQIF